MKLVTQITADLKARLEKLYAGHERVDIAIESILEGQQGGTIKLWVDDLDSATISKIEHGSFIRFAGDPEESKEAKLLIKELKIPFFVQPSPLNWIKLLEKEYGEKLKQTNRYTLSSAHLRKSHLEEIVQQSPWKDSVKRLDKHHARQLKEDDWGQYHFMNYSQPEDLPEKGMAYGIEIAGEIVSCCSSALVSRKGYEVNIITDPRYRQQGMAKAVAAKFIAECLERGMEPHWDAANDSSRRLAMRLGYEFAGEYTLYYVM